MTIQRDIFKSLEDTSGYLKYFLEKHIARRLKEELETGYRRKSVIDKVPEE